MRIVKDIDPDEWRELIELEREAIRHHLLPPALATYQLLVGEDLRSPRLLYRDISRSWVRNAYIHALDAVIQMSIPTQYRFYGTGGLYMRSIDSYDRSPPIFTSSEDYIYVGSTGDNSRGPVAGTGTDPESFGSWRLSSIIPHGTGTGQMSYGNTSYTYSWSTSDRRFSAAYVRNLLNISGSAIGVREVGLYMLCSYYDSYRLMAIRDLLSSTITVNHGEQLQITYTLYGPAIPNP